LGYLSTKERISFSKSSVTSSQEISLIILSLVSTRTTEILSRGVPKRGASGQKGMISYSLKASITAFISLVLPS